MSPCWASFLMLNQRALERLAESALHAPHLNPNV
jgi:hypothetical protein